MNSMRVFDAILTNLAVRNFQDRPINEEHLQRILDAGRLCQSGKNLQPWHFIVIRDRNLLNRLADLMKGDPDEPIVRRVPLAVALLSDPEYDSHSVDIGRVAQNMTLAAWELEVGSCFMWGPEPPDRKPYREAARALLGIPDRFDFVGLLVFGYPKQLRMAKQKKRKQLREIVSENRFGTPFVVGIE